jgi:ATP-dependent phosphoenolpyruvate carboxykinase
MPETGIIPMYGSASHAPCNPADRAIFFGLSGTGKTTLSADPSRRLTCDACGVLPPIVRLAAAQAMYHFLSGFTSRVAGTEQGVTDPQPAFSACFGAPFMLRRPEVYGKLLQAKIARYGAACWLVYTGWTGVAFGTVRRMPIRAKRALLTAAPDGSLSGGRFRRDPNFGFDVPVGFPAWTVVCLTRAAHGPAPRPMMHRRKGRWRCAPTTSGNICPISVPARATLPSADLLRPPIDRSTPGTARRKTWFRPATKAGMTDSRATY